MLNQRVLTLIYVFISYFILPPPALSVVGGRARETGPKSLEEILVTLTVTIVIVGVISVYSVRKAVLAKTQKAIWYSLIVLIIAMFTNIMFFSIVYIYVGMHDNLLTSLYFSMVTWTTLGYGDFAPNEAARFYAAFEALIGYLYLGVFVSVFYRCLTFSGNKT